MKITVATVVPWSVFEHHLSFPKSAHRHREREDLKESCAIAFVDKQQTGTAWQKCDLGDSDGSEG